MSNIFKGRIIHIEPWKKGVSQKTQSEWRSVEFVMEDSTPSQYPERILLRTNNDHIVNTLADLAPCGGDNFDGVYTAYFDHSARKSDKLDRWFGENTCWKLEKEQ